MFVFQVVNAVMSASTVYASVATQYARDTQLTGKYCLRVAALTVQEQTVAWILVDKTDVATSIARGL